MKKYTVTIGLLLLLSVQLFAQDKYKDKDPVENRLWISFMDKNYLSIFDIIGRSFKDSETVGKSPTELLLDSNSGRIWVLNEGSKDVAVVDSVSGTIRRKIEIGRNPTVISIENLSPVKRVKRAIPSESPSGSPVAETPAEPVPPEASPTSDSEGDLNHR